jgi:ribosomal protein S11
MENTLNRFREGPPHLTLEARFIMNPTQDTPEKDGSASAETKMTDSKPKKEKKPVAKKPAPKKTAPKAAINKSEEIRKVAKELQATGEKVRPKTIVEILKKRGIKIAPPQASMVLGKMGFRRKKRQKSGAAAGTAVSVVKKTSKSTLSVDDLLRAKKMAEEFGGAEKLVNAISKLVELQ